MVSFTAPDGARAERVKETAAHRRMRRARSEARIMLRLVQACSVLQGHHGSAVPRFLRSFQRVSIASADAETQCGVNSFATVEVATQCDVGVGMVDAEAQCETHGESSEAQKVDYATQCDFDGHEDYDLVSGQMALLTGWWERSSSTASWVGSKGDQQQSPTMGCARRRRRGGVIDSHAELGPSATERAWERCHKPHGAVGPWSCAAVPLTHGHHWRREYGVGVRA